MTRGNPNILLTERRDLNESVHELDNLLDDLNKARVSDEKSYGKRLDQQQRFYSSMSSLNVAGGNRQTPSASSNKYNNSHHHNHHYSYQQSPTPLQKLASSASREVDECNANLEMELKKNSLPSRGVFVKDVVEEEILVDHVPLYQPKTQRSDRRALTKSTRPGEHRAKRQVAFSEYATSQNEDNDETYDNTDTETDQQHHLAKDKHQSGSMMSLNSAVSDASDVSSTTMQLDPSKVVMCHVCDQRVLGQVITALGRSYHKEHFTCAHCGQELGTKNFYERDNKPYCEKDYQALFSPKCAACAGPILDKVTIALDQTFHPEHFVCAHCGCQFETDDGFHEKDGKPYCKNDFFELFANKCAGCALPITANYITALNAQWHPDCFVCSDCHCPFGEGKFFDIDGAPYCEIHYHARRGSLCAACKLPVIGKCTTAMFRKFHTDHFTCTYCLKVLTKTFKEEADKPYCHECFDKLFS